MIVIAEGNISRVVTLGCRLNKAESNVIATYLQQGMKSDVMVVNTCAVTNEAVRQSRQAVRSLHRTFPNRAIIATGCAATLEPEIFHKIEGVAAVVSNDKKHLSRYFVPSPTNKNLTLVPRPSQYSVRAFVQVQNGCDHSCTFCAITQARGSSRSVSQYHILKTIKNYLTQGVREIILTGVNITSYRREGIEDSSLGRLIWRILNTFPELARLSFGSLDPADVISDDFLMKMIASQKRVSPYIHLSLQSGDPIILKRMKRRHQPEQVLRLCQKLRAERPEILFGADMIAGFPTESECMFQRTLGHIEALRLHHIHVFPFSPRDITVASRMPQVASRLIKRRAKNLRVLAKRLKEHNFQTWCHTQQSILMTAPNFGLNPYNTNIFLDDSYRGRQSVGQIVNATITSHNGQALFGYLSPTKESNTSTCVVPS